MLFLCGCFPRFFLTFDFQLFCCSMSKGGWTHASHYFSFPPLTAHSLLLCFPPVILRYIICIFYIVFVVGIRIVLMGS